jgi:hypothetical protein
MRSLPSAFELAGYAVPAIFGPMDELCEIKIQGESKPLDWIRDASCDARNVTGVSGLISRARMVRPHILNMMNAVPGVPEETGSMAPHGLTESRSNDLP